MIARFAYARGYTFPRSFGGSVRRRRLVGVYAKAAGFYFSTDGGYNGAYGFEFAILRRRRAVDAILRFENTVTVLPAGPVRYGCFVYRRKRTRLGVYIYSYRCELGYAV